MVPVVFVIAGRRNPPTPRCLASIVVAIAVLMAASRLACAVTIAVANPVPLVAMLIVGLVLMQSPRIAQQWERGIILASGRFIGLRGPGLFWVVPFVDSVSSWIDQRTITTSFAAEQTLTSDTGAGQRGRRALLDGARRAEGGARSAGLHAGDQLGGANRAARHHRPHDAHRLLRGRERIEAELQQLIDQRSNPWGVTVSSVEMRDVVIPGALQDAMSREAQAAREKQARIILGQAEMEIANSFREAAKSYHEDPTALHLRAMNMLYEGLKEKGALMLIPSSAVESMGMGGLMGAAALQQQTLTGGASEGRVGRVGRGVEWAGRARMRAG
jgi:hypothetical protein